MEDVQNRQADVPMPIDSVGIRNLRLPIRLSRRDGGSRHTVAMVELGVELPASFKGTHMSRFVEALQSWDEDLNYAGMKKLLDDAKSSKIQKILDEDEADAQKVGISGTPCFLVNDIVIRGALQEDLFRLALDMALADAQK